VNLEIVEQITDFFVKVIPPKYAWRETTSEFLKSSLHVLHVLGNGKENAERKVK